MPGIVCDLVLLSWNQLEETKPCLETLFASVHTPCRLLLVDNASEEPVRQFLKAIRPQGAIQEVILLQNGTNEGFSRGMNRGLRLSQAPFVCLLNNDLRFTDGWLEELIAVASRNPSVGLVNPGSNTFGNRPAQGVSIEDHANRLRQYTGTYSEIGMSIGFCLLIKQEVIQRIGFLTEEVDCCFFEDEDYSMRAQEAGYHCVVAEGAYVHHTEHASVKKLGHREALFKKNQRWCNRRWGRRIRVAWPRFAPPTPGSAELRQWLERLLAFVRRRAHLYVYCPMPEGMSSAALFQSVGLEPHSDIHWQSIPHHWTPLFTCGAIAKRQKKRFDLIVAPQPDWGRWMEGLRWLHRADIVLEKDEEHLSDLWKRRSQSPL